jgi:hypothetical protein
MRCMDVTIYEVAYATRNNKRTGTIKGYRNTAKRVCEKYGSVE